LAHWWATTAAASSKAHAKLADELRVLLLVAGQLAHEVLGAAFGNGAQMLNGFLLAHADTVVGNGEGFGGSVKRHAHFQIGRVFVQFRLVERLKAQLVAGVGGVGDQLTDKNFRVGIQRMRDQVQQLDLPQVKPAWALFSR
jgi:hypothetical protein